MTSKDDAVAAAALRGIPDAELVYDTAKAAGLPFPVACAFVAHDEGDGEMPMRLHGPGLLEHADALGGVDRPDVNLLVAFTLLMAHFRVELNWRKAAAAYHAATRQDGRRAAKLSGGADEYADTVNDLIVDWHWHIRGT